MFARRFSLRHDRASSIQKRFRVSSVDSQNRILSGMRSTGKLHLGHYHGVLKNWVKLQHEYECFFFAADLHALTTHYESPWGIETSVWDMLIDWLAAGVDPGSATIFVQSKVPEHAELHLLLSMLTPLGWLERVPTYKDQQEALKDKDLATYGFLGYPLLQSADILMYRAGQVPVGADQISHIELTREVARRFNHIYGREPDFEAQAESAIKKMGKKPAKLYNALRKKYNEQGDEGALETARALVKDQQNVSMSDRDRLLGYLGGGGRVILPEPQALLTPDSKMPGLDGRKMSKSYGNAINLREEPEEVALKIKTMPTDPARVRRTDPGNPEKCPVWPLHKIYSSESTQKWVWEGCTTAGIGCIECKHPLAEAINDELRPIRERGKRFEKDPRLLRSIIADGNDKARDAAKQTMEEVRQVMGLSYD